MSQDKIQDRISSEEQDFLKVESDLRDASIEFSFNDCAKYQKNWWTRENANLDEASCANLIIDTNTYDALKYYAR